MSLALQNEMHARRHPRAILLVWIWTALSGLVLAWPAAVDVGREFHMSPDSDAPLFRAGSLDLLDYLWRARSGITTEIGHIVVVLPLAVVGSVVPLALLLASIAGIGAGKNALRSLGRLLSFELGALVIQALLLWGSFLLAAMTAYGFGDSLGEKRADFAGAVVFALGAMIAIAISIARDLASASTIASASGFIDSLVHSFHTFGSRTGAIVYGWLWRSLVGLIAVVLAGVLASRIGGKSGLSLLLLLFAHQAALAWRVAWRASWLAASLRFTQPTTTPE
jgi:hypothetical protein